jgi:hypothetical protein
MANKSGDGTLPCLATVFLCVLALTLLCFGVARAESRLTVAAGQTEKVQVPFVSETWGATAALPRIETGRQAHFLGHFPGFDEAKRLANQKRLPRLPAIAQAHAQAAAQQTPSGSATPVVFQGPSESDTNEIPPDSQLAAGPNNIVVLINSLIAIYDKSGNLQGSLQPLSSFFASLSINGSIFDPRIIYDSNDSRFILSAAEIDFTGLSNGHVLLAVSQTSDPTGLWNKYAVDFEGTNLTNTGTTYPDFPTLGLSSSAVYVSTGQFTLTTACVTTDAGECSFSDTWIKVIGLPELLAGDSTLSITTFRDVLTAAGTPAFAVEPAITYGASSEEFLVGANFIENPATDLNVFSINTSGTPELSAADLAVPQYSQPPDAVQPDGSLVATNDFRLLNAVWNNSQVWTAQDVADSNGNAIAEWYEISAASLSSLKLTDSGTISGSGDAYFPAISVKPNGDAGVAFTTSSLLQFPSSALTGRAGSDAASSMRAPAIYFAGTANYNDFALRWGDYSGASLDPDGNSIWMITEYAGSPDPHFGTAVAQMSGPPALTPSALTLDFGTQPVGFATQPQTLTITNGGAGSLTLGSFAITGADPSDFAIGSDSCSNAMLAAGKSCTVDLTFTPSTTGSRTATLSLATSPASFVPSVALSGIGQALMGSLVLLPESLTFPDTAVRGASAPQSLTLTNAGKVAFAISYVTAGSGSGFTQTNNCGGSLAAGKSCTITVTFRPTVALLYTLQSIQVVGTGNSFVSSSLSGTGIAAPEATPCPTTVNFGNQAAGTKSPAQRVTLSNTGSATLTVTLVSSSGDFAETDTCKGSKLLPEAACDIDVTFAPTAGGTRTGTLTIADNASSSSQKIALTGNGVTNSGSVFKATNTLAALPASHIAPAPSSRFAETRSRALGAYGKLPLSFEANRGQASAAVRFISRGAGYSLLLTANSAVLALSDAAGDSDRRNGRRSGYEPDAARGGVAVRIRLIGADPSPVISGVSTLPGTTNYFRGNDPRRWFTRVPNYEKVLYRGVYPGVDLLYYGNQRQLEYDFMLAPHANPAGIKLHIDVTGSGATEKQHHRQPRSWARHRLQISSEGDLLVAAGGHEIRLRRPALYQTAASGASPKRKRVWGRYVLLDHSTVGIAVGAYDKTKMLVIDPELSYSTYLGGKGMDAGYGIALDSAGDAYITGSTQSANFPIVNGFQSTINFTGGYGTDAFVTKLSADGSQIVYSTFLGGSRGGLGSGIAVGQRGRGLCHRLHHFI